MFRFKFNYNNEGFIKTRQVEKRNNDLYLYTSDPTVSEYFEIEDMVAENEISSYIELKELVLSERKTMIPYIYYYFIADGHLLAFRECAFLNRRYISTNKTLFVKYKFEEEFLEDLFTEILDSTR